METRRALTFTESYDELGPGVQAFAQLDQGTFRLWSNSTDPAGRSLVVLASPGEPIAQVIALLTVLDLPGRVLTQLWNGQGWLTGRPRPPEDRSAGVLPFDVAHALRVVS